MVNRFKIYTVPVRVIKIALCIFSGQKPMMDLYLISMIPLNQITAAYFEKEEFLDQTHYINAKNLTGRSAVIEVSSQVMKIGQYPKLLKSLKL